MKKAVLITVNLFVFILGINAQKLRVGIYAGAGFANVKSDYSEVSILPVTEGGLSAHYGIHLNIPIVERVEFETGLQKVTKGYNYWADNAFAEPQYTKIQCASVPAVLLFHILNYPDEVPFRFSIGLGAYMSYAVSGKITSGDGTKTDAGFSNAKRNETGPRWMMKWEFAHKVECYLSNDMKSTNIIKNGGGYIKQGSFQVGFGYIF